MLKQLLESSRRLWTHLVAMVGAYIERLFFPSSPTAEKPQPERQAQDETESSSAIEDISEMSPDGVREEGALGTPRSQQSARLMNDGEPVTRMVFFGTDREVLSHSPVAFGPSTADVLRFGRVEVTIPPNHRMGRLETPQRVPKLNWQLPYDPMKHIVVNYAHLLADHQFFPELDREWDDAKSAFVFVHGFATSFRDAARRTAQLHYDLKFPGPPIMFSWASAGSVDLSLYNKDGEASLASAEFLRAFLDRLVTNSDVQTLHVIAHSMGNRTLIEALRKWDPPKPTPLRQVVLVAPDVNRRHFRQLASEFRRACHRTTLYGSERDFALWISRQLAGNEGRAGDSRPPLVVDGVETIDVSDMDISNDALSHFLLDDDRVLGDMKELIDSDLPLERRLRLEPIVGDDGGYWRMKKS